MFCAMMLSLPRLSKKGCESVRVTTLAYTGWCSLARENSHSHHTSVLCALAHRREWAELGPATCEKFRIVTGRSLQSISGMPVRPNTHSLIIDAARLQIPSHIYS